MFHSYRRKREATKRKQVEDRQITRDKEKKIVMKMRKKTKSGAITQKSNYKQMGN